MQNGGLQSLLADWQQTEERFAGLAEAYSQAPFGRDYQLKAELDELYGHREVLLATISEFPVASPEEAASKLEIVASSCADDHKPAIQSVIAYLRSLAPYLMMASALDPVLYRGMKMAGVALSRVFSIA